MSIICAIFALKAYLDTESRGWRRTMEKSARMSKSGNSELEIGAPGGRRACDGPQSEFAID